MQLQSHMPHYTHINFSRMKRARDDGDVITSGSAAMGDGGGDTRSYPNHGGDDERAEHEERRQREIACQVLLSLSLSSWPSSSSHSTSCSAQQNDHAAGTTSPAAPPPPNNNKKPRGRRRRRRGTAEEFECQTCGRRFPTFQALGGHRTSHLRRPPATTNKKPPRVLVHACAMCGLAFSTGQALGGHMRRHRVMMGRADGLGFPSAAGVDLTQIVVHGRPTSTSSTSLQLLNLFV